MNSIPPAQNVNLTPPPVQHLSSSLPVQTTYDVGNGIKSIELDNTKHCQIKSSGQIEISHAITLLPIVTSMLAHHNKKSDAPNIHPIRTRSKSGIRKTKLLLD